jgi:hypothetical protein
MRASYLSWAASYLSIVLQIIELITSQWKAELQFRQTILGLFRLFYRQNCGISSRKTKSSQLAAFCLLAGLNKGCFLRWLWKKTAISHTHLNQIRPLSGVVQIRARRTQAVLQTGKGRTSYKFCVISKTEKLRILKEKLHCPETGYSNMAKMLIKGRRVLMLLIFFLFSIQK